MNKTVLEQKPKFSKMYILAIPIVGFILLTVFLTIESASYGARLASLEQKAFLLEKENRDLSAQLVESTSLSELSGKTEELGFSKPLNIVYVSQEKVVADSSHK